jgi:hypothetical protein
MGTRQLDLSSKKVSCSIYLEVWMWDWVDSLEGNRSEFFRNLIKDEIKRELMEQGLMTEEDVVTETLGEVYKNIKKYKRNLTGSFNQRRFIRDTRVSVERTRKAISITIDKWLWDIAGSIEYNRSLYFKKLLLNKLEQVMKAS